MLDFKVEIRGTLAGKKGSTRFLRGDSGKMLILVGTPFPFDSMNVGKRVVAVGGFDEKAFIFRVESMSLDGRFTKANARDRGIEGGNATASKYSAEQRAAWASKAAKERWLKRDAKRKKLSTP